MPSEEPPIRLIQLTDTHFFATSEGRLLGVDTAASFAEVWKVAKTLHQPDFYLFTGDLSQDETEGSYQRLAQAVADAGAPAYCLPGNHDRREELARGLASSGVFQLERALTAGNWRIVLLDSLIEGEVGGRLEQEELERLDSELTQHADKHVLVSVHHHPVPMGASWIDTIGIANADQMLSIVSKHKNVRVILWGHVHQEFSDLRDGIHYLATPSTCVQFKPRSADFALDIVPPGCRWLELHADGTLRTEVIRTSSVAAGLEVTAAGY